MKSAANIAANAIARAVIATTTTRENNVDINDDAALTAFKAVTTALLELKDEGAQQRVLRAAAILIGMDFIEEQRKRRS